jgi:mannitol/fructose-specific phosphotransferase system IIA component (Ntr-type)
MKLSDFVCIEAAITELQASDRDGAIMELVSALGETGRFNKGKSREIAAEVIKRENEASTGLGKGVAVPHVKHKAVKDVIATIGQSSAGINFFALDKQPVYSVILLISPMDDPDKHLQAMEKIFRHLQQEKFRKFLRQCRSNQQIEDPINEVDEDPSLQ